MSRLIPGSLFGRTVALLLIGLVVTHFASIAVHYSSRGEAINLVADGLVAERVAATVRLFESAPVQQRPQLAFFVRRPGFAVSWGPQAALPLYGHGGAGGGILEAMLALSLDGIDRTRLRAVLEEPKETPTSADWFAPSLRGNGNSIELLEQQHRRMLGDDPGFSSPRLHVSVALLDGSWLNMSVLLPPRPPFWSGRALVSLAVTLVLVVLVVVWAVRRMTRPLAIVAAAADRLGRDVNAPPLPIRGANEVRRAASAFNRMQERIRSLVETRTRMLAAISHDLRTPITRLRLRAEFIEDDEVRAKTMADLAEMEDMVSSVLAFAREDAQTEERETVDLAALVQSVCDNLSDTGNDCEFTETDSMPFKCRQLSLRRAVTNLANNAIAYGERARLSLLEEPGHIVIRVDDDGPGVPEEQLARIFEPFVRLEDSRNRQTGGTGLGLCIVQSVAEAHGGKVRLSNRPEGGLRAELVLPS